MLKRANIRLGAIDLSLLALLVMAAFLLETACPQTPRSGDQVCDADGVKLYFSTMGQGEPVVLIHGFCANRQVQWILPGIMDQLAKTHHVIAHDNRGHGRSDKPHEVNQYGVEMVKDVIRLMDHLKLPKAHVVGYSMGGFITMKLLAEHPDRLLSATVGGAGWYRKELPGNINLLAESLEKGEGITPLIQFLTPPGQARPSEDRLRIMNRLLMATNDPKALAACARGMKHLVVPETQLKDNRVPLLVLIGDQDPLHVGLDELKKVKPRCHVVELKDANHMNTFSKPDFIAALKKFLQEPGQFTAPANGTDR